MEPTDRSVLTPKTSHLPSLSQQRCTLTSRPLPSPLHSATPPPVQPAHTDALPAPAHPTEDDEARRVAALRHHDGRVDRRPHVPHGRVDDAHARQPGAAAGPAAVHEDGARARRRRVDCGRHHACGRHRQGGKVAAGGGHD